MHPKTTFITDYAPLKEFYEANLAQEVEPYPCKFESECKQALKFNAQSFSCNHGGGTGCRVWRRKTNLEIGSRRLPGDA
ncbi:MAG: hypothetical protein ABSF44_15420 [Candidatus Bathyarchaeia archaeon]|jgi:hypothetical protein